MAYKILSLDGGGSWSLIQVRALLELYGEQVKGHAVLQRFNLVAANSGGAIVLGALLSNAYTLGELYAQYQQLAWRKKVFVKRKIPSLLRLKFIDIGPKYSTAAKLPGLQEVFNPAGAKRIPELPAFVGGDTQYLIAGFEYDSMREVFFRSNNASAASSSTTNLEPTLAEAVHAASTAPVNYFDTPAKFQTVGFENKRYWDGGIGGYNNPALIAVTEAVANGQQLSDVQILSLGTGATRLPVKGQGFEGNDALFTPACKRTLLGDIKKMASSILDEPPDAASFIAYVMLHGSLSPEDPQAQSRLVRMNPLLVPQLQNNQLTPYPVRGNELAANLQFYKQLVQVDMDAYSDEEVNLVVEMADAWVASQLPNQPVQARGDFTVRLGHSTFADAAQLAKSLFP